MAPRDLTDEEREHWEEATKDARRSRSAKRVVKTPTVKKPALPKPATAPAAAVALPKQKIKKQASPAPLSVLPKREGERMFKPHARTEARIDLHGMTQDEAHEALKRFITRCHAAGKRHVAVITGKGSRGEGVLRRAVPRWLELPELRRIVSAVTHAAPEKGGEGVLHVLLKKPS